ncbi:MAG: OmpH family outer membrane protein [Deltaproteobacteria bacterium]|jgi:Skp family chaperone for outer membrane proteins|nr:OmpH family outer membrane protein [Deltaproteobacteria bacterium]
MRFYGTNPSRPLWVLFVILALFLSAAPLEAQEKGKSPNPPAKGAPAPEKEKRDQDIALVPPLEGEAAAPKADAAPPASVTIAVIDMTKAIEESATGKSLQAKFKSDFDKTSEKMNQRGKDLEKKVEEFNRTQGALSESEREKAKTALEKEIGDFEKETRKASDDFRSQVEKAMSPLYDRAEKIASDLAKTNKYTAVVENGSANAIIYAEPRIAVVDITGDVTKALNAKSK